MYSLINAPVLGFDLTRLDGGPATAEVLLRALAVGAAELPALAAGLRPGSRRSQAWREVRQAAARQHRVRDLLGLADPADAVATLERAPIGSVEALLHCVRHDVFGWTWRFPDPDGPGRQDQVAGRACAVVCDAVVAQYLRDLLPVPARRELTVPWLRAGRTPAVPPDTGSPDTESQHAESQHAESHADLGPQQPALLRLLDRVRTMTAPQRHRLADAATRGTARSQDWAACVHSASWAVHLSGRIRTAASAQLLLVGAVDEAGVSIADRAGGVWNLLSGAAQALVVRDVLDSETAAQLLTPYVGALGTGGSS